MPRPRTNWKQKPATKADLWLTEISPKFKLDSQEEDSRKKKVIERFEDVHFSQRKEPKIDRRPGKGVKLAEHPIVVEKLAKLRKEDPFLRSLHKIVMGGRVNKLTPLKEDLLDFSGVVYDEPIEGRKKLLTRLGKLKIPQLKEYLYFFGLEKDGSREDLINRLANFLENPQPTGPPGMTIPINLITPKKRKSTGPDSQKKKRPKDPNAPKKPLSAYMLFCQDNRIEVVRDHPNEKITEIAKILAEKWKNISKELRLKYEEGARRDKERYEQELKAYQARQSIEAQYQEISALPEGFQFTDHQLLQLQTGENLHGDHDLDQLPSQEQMQTAEDQFQEELLHRQLHDAQLQVQDQLGHIHAVHLQDTLGHQHTHPQVPLAHHPHPHLHLHN